MPLLTMLMACGIGARYGLFEPVYDDDDTGVSECEVAPELALDVFTIYCYECHGRGGSDSGGINYITDLARLADSPFVNPGDPDASTLMIVVNNGYMPLAPRPDLGASEQSALRSWIVCGAEPVFDEPRDFITQSEHLAAVRNDLEEEVPEDDQPFTRYITLVHLYNAGILDAELRAYQGSIAKLLLSLTREVPDAYVPDAVRLPSLADDDLSLIYRIDLRDYGWHDLNGFDGWEFILRHYPYGIYLTDGIAGQHAAKLRELSRSRLPYVNGDWLAFASTQPPLYFELLDVPRTLDSFLADFGVTLVRESDQWDNLVGPSLAAECAGFAQSGVSVSNRVVCRQNSAFEDASSGYCWVSYDFASNVGLQNVFAHPVDFREDGGEAICSLQNGQQAYFVNDGAGSRIDRGPVQVVDDPLQEPDAVGDTVTTGISCMRCHNEGIIPATDEVRIAVEANPDVYPETVVAAVKDRYVESEELRDRIQEDRLAFEASLQLAGVAVDEPEPISSLVAQFEAKMDLARVSAELGITEQEFLSLLDADPTIAEDVPQLRTGGLIDRDVFDEVVRELICDLRLGECYGPDDGGCGPSQLPCEAWQTCSDDPETAGMCL